MILTFNCKQTEALFNHKPLSKFRAFERIIMNEETE
jgi:hypothetical protein